MTKLLLKLFVKEYRNTEDAAVRSAIGTLAGSTGILCNCLLALGKLLAGWAAGSVAMIADGANNLSDAASSVVTLLGFRLARRPADADHPYGHARYEYLSGLVVSVLILWIGVELARSSVEKILSPQPLEATALTYGVLAVSILVKLWMTGFYGKLGRSIDSATLRAAARDSRNDVFATGAVLLSCLVSRVWGVDVDGVTGLAVAVFILYSGVVSANETVSPLLGKGADAELVEKLTQTILAHEQILGIHDLLVHDYGPGQCYASVHAELSARVDPLVCHDILDSIESDVLSRWNIHLVIHYDPVATDDREWEEMGTLVRETVAALSPRLSIHDFRVIRDGGEKRLVFDLAVPYGMELEANSARQRVEAALAAEDKEYSVVIRMDRTE